MNYSIKEIAGIIKAQESDWEETTISVLLTDSRSLTFPEESLFFALKTKQNDGHKYISELYKKGVRNFVVTHIPETLASHTDINFLIVPDTLIALQQLAAAHRKRFNIPIIGIAGSNGKTIVKEWLYQLLQPDYNIVRSPRSYNSQIGVPLSVWQLNERSQIGIFEAGISTRGEMDRLQSVLQPTIGIMTNIGDAHQDGFASVQEKCFEKLGLFTQVDTLIYDGDSSIIINCIENMCMGTRDIAWSKRDRERPLFISKIERHENSTTIHYSFLLYDASFTIPFIEEASVENAIHCLTVMLYMGIAPSVIADRMAQLEPVAMRMEVKEGHNDCLIINDTYNSDINSLDIALDFLVRRAAASGMKKTLILSDILQSGMLTTTLYKKVADILSRKGIDRLIGIGRDLSANAKLFKMKKEFYETTQQFLFSKSIEHFNRELILIKGSREFHFEVISETLELKQHETILEVNLDAVVHNYNYYRQLLKPTTQMVCMVKAFGYGAGSYELAKTLQEHGCEYLAVAVGDEGAELRKAGISTPIMVMNPEMNGFRTLFSYSLEPEIYSFRLLKAFMKEAERLGITNYPIHIKIDSGMHRLGFTETDMETLAELLKNQNTVVCRSIFSHLAGSDESRFDDFTRQQIEIFSRCADSIQKVSPQRVIRHILNTAGIARFTDAQMDMVRLGIGLYGISSSGAEQGLRPVSTLRTTILQIKNVSVSETVGYSRKGTLKRDSRIAAIPIGYADGLDRRLGNRIGSVWINGQLAPIVGNICMDVCMVDVTDVECQEGDRVEIFGEHLPVEQIARQLDTIPYEIIASVSTRVKRIYFRE